MSDSSAIYLDVGTTNTRIWLARGQEIIARGNSMVGVRDTARDGSSNRLRTALRNLILEVSAHSEANQSEPLFIAAAGMITSSLGLVEVPHIKAPAGVDEMRTNLGCFKFPEITSLPVFLVPGLRTGARDVDLNSIDRSDLMRGEETMCIGLIESGLAPKPCTILNLGSHWKVISIDQRGKITGSITTLSGEMIHTTQTQTILASAVPHTRPEFLATDWLKAGMLEQRRSGLARAMFCVRLLEQGGRSTPEERLSFLIGAFIASDFDALIERKILLDPVIITGGGAIAEAWRSALTESSLGTEVISAEDIERSYLTGLREITK
ncbi:MAG: 2-dehydro-3-deoxygalactonokinase [Acidobacteria bacterium]|nr:2-dehydro-3-deoxygalactonokinase [Acidobacteriota bacterium]